MKKLLLFIILVNFIIFQNIFSQKIEMDENNKDETSISLVLNQDPIFGFYPSAYGTLPINEKQSFTFYGIFWTTGGFDEGKEGLSLVGEFGVGINFSLFDDQLNINPSIGIGNGRYQSGANRTVVLDNFVLNLLFDFNKEDFNTNGGIIYWLAGRREGYPQINMYNYFLSAGYSFSRNFETGIYFEDMVTREKVIEKDEIITKSYTSYLWLGPYIKFKVSSGAFLSAYLGVDLADYTNSIPDDNKRIKDFYKLSLGFEL